MDKIHTYELLSWIEGMPIEAGTYLIQTSEGCVDVVDFLTLPNNATYGEISVCGNMERYAPLPTGENNIKKSKKDNLIIGEQLIEWEFGIPKEEGSYFVIMESGMFYISYFEFINKENKFKFCCEDYDDSKVLKFSKLPDYVGTTEEVMNTKSKTNCSLPSTPSISTIEDTLNTMERNIVYVDANGFRYVKGDIGGGDTINWDGGCYNDYEMKLWDYCNDVTEKEIVRFCKKTDEKIKA